MRDRRAALVAAAKLVFRQMHAMRQHGAPADQPMMIVDVEIVLPLGKQLGRPFDLAAVLRDVGLHQHVRMLAPQRARRIELRRRAGAGKARRDGIEGAPAAVPARDQRLGVVVALLRGVAQLVRRVAVHQHLAGDDPHAAALGLGEQRIDRLRIDRAEHQRRGRAVAQELVAEHLRHRGRVRRILERHLGRKSVAVEPVEQLLAVGGDHRRSARSAHACR